jgi:TPR repeat protein
VSVSVQKAARLFEFAAERNEFFAMIELARIYARGVLGTANRELASKWYAAAVAQEQSVSGCDEELREAKTYLA